jgi:ABC-2 type transport system permease protein
MLAFVTLVRRELGGHFLSLTGYVIIATVLLLLGFSLNDIITKLNGVPIDAPITEVVYSTVYFWLILVLTTPVITMRTFALEKFTGTFETLMTTPIGDITVVLAKFCGSLIFFVFAWLPLIAYLVILRRFVDHSAASIDLVALATTYLGIILIGALFISMGIFASALTRSQIIAAILSFAFVLVLFMLSMRSLVAVEATGWEADFFAHISMTEHMQEFARGVLQISSLTFYITLTVFFLFLTWKVIESRRWK